MTNLYVPRRGVRRQDIMASNQGRTKYDIDHHLQLPMQLITHHGEGWRHNPHNWSRVQAQYQ
jgi:hypothetical protein